MLENKCDWKISKADQNGKYKYLVGLKMGGGNLNDNKKYKI
ncbi:hypothetical protein [Campylobacter jejuni]|nr:hypothetical protein [Campylobacter jejuni]